MPARLPLLSFALAAAAEPSCHDWPQTCPGVVPRPPYKQTWLMRESTIIQPCNTGGYMPPETTKGWGIVDFDWSNGKGAWVKHRPMDDEEMLYEQVKITANASKGTTIWVYRNTVYAYPWYTSVRRTLEDPAYADWFMKFKPEGPWHSEKCDRANRSLCSEYYHSQEQTPGYPHGDGDCAAPGCDCGSVPCGFYVWNHSTTTVVHGQSFQDWFVHSYNLNEVGMSPLVSGFFWDDVWNPECNIHDQVPGTCQDMGFHCPNDKCDDPRLVQLTKDYQKNMAALREAALAAGKFAWQMLWTGGEADSIGDGQMHHQLVTRKNCTTQLRELCNASSPAQTRAVAYTLSGQPEVRNKGLIEDLTNFLLIRGPYSWLGWGFKGCNRNFYWPPEFDVDYGVPSGICRETEPGVFRRDFSKSTVTMDCNSWQGSITMKEAATIQV